MQNLITQFEAIPRYWTQSNPPYEVDFLIQRENDIIPVEGLTGLVLEQKK